VFLLWFRTWRMGIRRACRSPATEREGGRQQLRSHLNHCLQVSSKVVDTFIGFIH
jgi:hypothetical protein